METVVANSMFFDNDINKVPKMACTVGVGTVMDAEEVSISFNLISKNNFLALQQSILMQYSLHFE